jgi:hypothetical protein
LRKENTERCTNTTGWEVSPLVETYVPPGEAPAVRSIFGRGRDRSKRESPGEGGGGAAGKLEAVSGSPVMKIAHAALTRLALGRSMELSTGRGDRCLTHRFPGIPNT